MPEHNTRQSATERLEEAVQTLSQAHSAMNDELESILDRLSVLAIPAAPTTPTSQPNQHHHHLKLEIPRFDGQDPLGWIFKISQFFDHLFMRVIVDLITKFAHLFSEPTSLPPFRHISHHIHLHPHTSPINVKPYRYPYYQKAELEKQVASMLKNGLIRISQSPFSSPV